MTLASSALARSFIPGDVLVCRQLTFVTRFESKTVWDRGLKPGTIVTVLSEPDRMPARSPSLMIGPEAEFMLLLLKDGTIAIELVRSSSALCDVIVHWKHLNA